MLFLPPAQIQFIVILPSTIFHLAQSMPDALSAVSVEPPLAPVHTAHPLSSSLCCSVTSSQGLPSLLYCMLKSFVMKGQFVNFLHKKQHTPASHSFNSFLFIYLSLLCFKFHRLEIFYLFYCYCLSA